MVCAGNDWIVLVMTVVCVGNDWFELVMTVVCVGNVVHVW